MRKLFATDSFLRIISFVIAILLWIFVILVVNPPISTKISNIPVRYANKTVLEERGLVIVEGGDAKVSIKVQGSRNAIANIDKKSISAVVDVGDLEGTGSHTRTIKIEEIHGVETISQDPVELVMVVDKIVSEEREIEIKVKGEVGDGYIAGEPAAATPKVTLTGASTILAKIKSVRVELDLKGRSEDINDREMLCFVDENDKIIGVNDKIYKDVKMSIESVDVACPVMKQKTVDVEIPVVGSSTLYTWSSETKKISLYGNDQILEGIEKIQTEPLVLSNRMTEGTITLKLNIPDGIEVFGDKREIVINITKL